MGEPERNKADEFILLDFREYAKRLAVSRSTVYNWMSSGVLVPGHHYIKRGHVLRFFWSLHLVQEIHKASSRLEKGDAERSQAVSKKSTKALPEVQQTRSVRPAKTVANLNY
jgi:hypothetical protein